MADPLRWGILGASAFARSQMGPAIQLARGGQLTAMATRDPDKAAPFRVFAPGLRVHASYEDLLADPDIDAIYNPLPNSMHADWSIRALEAGKHVLCEKPVGMDVAEIDQLIAARDTADRLAAEAFMIVFHPQWQRTRALLADGAIGPLRHVQGVFSFDNRDDSGNIRNNAELGGGALRDIGVYVLGSARFATGAEPSEIAADIRYESGFDAFTRINAIFPGFTYNAAVSVRLVKAQEMSFFGETGVLRLRTPFNARVAGEAAVELWRSDGSVAIDRYPDIDQYVLQVEAFNAVARNGGDYACPLEFSRGTQAAMDAVLANGRALR